MDQLVPCRWCGALTEKTDTQECDQHWQLRHHIQRDPETAGHILATILQTQNSP